MYHKVIHCEPGLRAVKYLARMMAKAKFGVGCSIQHLRFGYRGVIVDVDARFEGTEEWYQTMAQSQPPRDAPWYHVLVHDADHMTYVAERNLEEDTSGEPIRHPLLEQFFDDFRSGLYVRDRALN